MENVKDEIEFKEIYNAGKEQTIQAEYEGIPVFIHPEGMRVSDLSGIKKSVEKWNDERADKPRVLQQNIELLTAESFIAYFNRFSNDSSTIFFDGDSAKFTGILDYHESNQTPAWMRHKCVYRCPKTPEWSSWLNHDNERMNQVEFALFIEENANEIVEPNAAEMLEIASSLKAKNNVNFKSGVRLDNGQTQFTYEENIDGKAGVKGQLEIPEKIKLHIQPFKNSELYPLEARFRYRITQNGLAMYYKLIRHNLMHDDAVNDAFETIKKGIERGHVFHSSI